MTPKAMKSRLSIGSVAALAMVLSACSSGSTHSSSSPSTVASAGSSATTSGTPIVIGTVDQLSGQPSPIASSDITAAYHATVTAWENYVNAHGGIHGRPVKVISMDDQGSPTIATADVKQLISDQASAIVTNYSSGIPSFEPAVDAAKVPVVSGYSVYPQFGSDPNYFPAAITLGASKILDFTIAKDHGWNSMGWLYVQTGSAQASEAADQKYAKVVGETTKDVFVSPSAPSYAPYCLAMKQAGIEFLNSDVNPRAADDCAAQGYHPTWFFVVFGSEPALISPVLKDSNMNGAIVSQFNFPWNSANPSAVSFRNALTSEGQSPSPTAAALWSAFLLVQYAADKVPTGSPIDGPALESQLYTIHNVRVDDLLPPLDFVQGQSNVSNCAFVGTLQNAQLPETDSSLKLTCAASSS
jgi:branched-chain amino acid transport system substrate-binding protein